MRWFRDLRLARKLAVSFAVLLAVTAGLGLFALRGAARVNAAATDLGGHWLPSVRHSLALSRAVADFRAAEAMHVIAASTGEKAGYEARMDAHATTIDETARRLRGALTARDDSAAFADYRGRGPPTDRRTTSSSRSRALGTRPPRTPRSRAPPWSSSTVSPPRSAALWTARRRVRGPGWPPARRRTRSPSSAYSPRSWSV